MKPDELFEDNTYNLKHQTENTTHVSQKRKKKGQGKSHLFNILFYERVLYSNQLQSILTCFKTADLHFCSTSSQKRNINLLTRFKIIYSKLLFRFY